MKTMTHARLLATLLGSALFLAACGGGGSAGTTASATSNAAVSTSSTNTSSATESSTQVAQGIVTGFGSVVVDGVEIEDAKASTHAADHLGGTRTAALRLGQRVRVEHDGAGNAARIEVDAAVIGSATAINSSTSSLKVAGQLVRANTDSAKGAVTAYGGGLAAFADIAANDLLEVHGSPVYNTTTAVYEVQASRIEKQATISALRVTGKLSALDASGKKFSINGLVVNYASATLTPATVTLANDQTVLVFGPSGALTTSGSVSTLAATRVHVSHGQGKLPSGAAQVGGLVSNFSAGSGTFDLQGLSVVAGTATVLPTGAVLANGAYVQVRGVFNAAGQLAATQLRVREADTKDDSAKILLVGAISNFLSTTSFSVRGIAIDASALKTPATCQGTTLADGVSVKVMARAQVGTDVVKADSLACAPSQVRIPVREVRGAVSGLSSGSKSFSITVGSTTIKVQYSDTTAFTGVTAATLANGNSIEAEGTFDSAGVLHAREISLHGSRDGDKFAPGGKGWDDYKKR